MTDQPDDPARTVEVECVYDNGCGKAAGECPVTCKAALDAVAMAARKSSEAERPFGDRHGPTPEEARRMLDVQGRCPACGWTTLFLGDGGHVTCSRLECPDPSAADDLLHRERAAANPPIIGLSVPVCPEHQDGAECPCPPDCYCCQPEPEDTCRPVEVDGETIRVRGAGELTEQDREFTAEIVRAAKAKMAAEPAPVRLRAEIAEALRNVEVGRWNIRAQTKAVMAAIDRHLEFGPEDAWCKTCRRVWNGPDHRCESDAEQRIAAVRDALAAFNDRGVLRIGHTNLDTPTAGEAIDAVRTALEESARTTPNNPATSKDTT